jgi:Flp pilus assembly protein CpaB
MTRALIVLVVALALAVLGGWLYLAYWHFPIASTPVEKVLPNARFPK